MIKKKKRKMIRNEKKKTLRLISQNEENYFQDITKKNKRKWFKMILKFLKRKKLFKGEISGYYDQIKDLQTKDEFLKFKKDLVYTDYFFYKISKDLRKF